MRSLALGFLIVGLFVAPVGAAPTVSGEFEVSGLDSNNKLTQGPDGNIWVTLSSATADVARITPAGEVTEFDLGAEGPSGIATGSDGNLWITRSGGVTKFAPADPEGTKAITTIIEITGSHSIVSGPDGNLWVATIGNLVRISPANPEGKEVFAVGGLAPRDIDTSGSLLAIADFGEKRIVTATTEAIPVTTPYVISGGPQGVAGGPGGQIAYTQPSEEPKEIGLFTPPSFPGVTSQLPGADPFGITFGPDGAYWSAEFNGDRLVRVTPDNQASSLTGFAAASGPRQIAAGLGNTLWVTLQNAKKVARVSGVDPPAASVSPPVPIEPRTQIVKGPKGKVKTRRKRATVKFRFISPDAGAGFECALTKLRKGKGKKGKAVVQTPQFRPCKSPRIYRLRPGRYRFEARAVLAGVADKSPAQRTFRVVRVT